MDPRSETSRPVTRCQVCSSGDLTSVLYLGSIPPVNTMPEIGSAPAETRTYPLELVRCGNCTLVQISLEVDPQILFPPDYPYRSGSTRILRENFAQLRDESIEVLGLSKEALVVDIGSNDGTLLANFRESGFRVLGVEPSRAAQDANDRGIPTLMRFFGRELASEITDEHGHATLVTAANVFAHIPNAPDIVTGIVDLLAPEGVFISESHYFPSLVKTLQYDTVYHEHLRYYTLRSLAFLLESGGLEVFHARHIPTHGGSIRVYAARPGRYSRNDSVLRIMSEEDAAGVTDGSALPQFRDRVAQSKLDLYELLAPLKRQGARIHGVGAPSRASTLLSYTGLDERIIDCIFEISTSQKLDKYMPGTRIPVLDEQHLFDVQPEYALLLSWHIADELVANLRRKGFKGQFLVPLPQASVVDG